VARVGLGMKWQLYGDDSVQGEIKAAHKAIDQCRKRTAHRCCGCYGEGVSFKFKEIKLKPQDVKKGDQHREVLDKNHHGGCVCTTTEWFREIWNGYELCEHCDGVGFLCSYCRKGKKECGCG
jgi:hypothetical protein